MKNLEKYLDCKYILYLDILGMFVFVLEKKIAKSFQNYDINYILFNN